VTAPLVVFRLALFPDRSLDGRRVPHGIGATGPRAPELGVVELYRSIHVDSLESSRGHRHRSRSADSAVDEDLVLDPGVFPEGVDGLSPGLAFFQRKRQQLRGRIERARWLAKQ